jgi:hypothetical protein
VDEVPSLGSDLVEGLTLSEMFADQWEFVRFATEQRFGLDFTSPPQRPEPAR